MFISLDFPSSDQILSVILKRALLAIIFNGRTQTDNSQKKLYLGKNMCSILFFGTYLISFPQPDFTHCTVYLNRATPDVSMGYCGYTCKIVGKLIS